MTETLRVGDKMRIACEFAAKLQEDEANGNVIMAIVQEIRLEDDGTKVLVMRRADSWFVPQPDEGLVSL